MNTYFSNVEINRSHAYFLYLGEIRGYELNEFLKRPFEKRYGKPVDFIAVVPDILPDYTRRNVLVINPPARRLREETGRRVVYRPTSREFYGWVSENEAIVKLATELSSRQGELFVHLLDNAPETTLDRLKGVRILGPDLSLAHRLNDRRYQYENFRDLVPMPVCRQCEDFSELIGVAERLWDSCRDGLFIALPHGAGGSHSIRARNQQDIEKRFAGESGPFLVSRFIPHCYDPSVTALAASEGEVFIGNVIEQNIEEFTKFHGSRFPSPLSEELAEKIIGYTRAVGREMTREGFRGVFGCDFIVTEGGAVFMVEVNARKQGTTLETCYAMQAACGPSTPTLMEMQYHAILGSYLPDAVPEVKSWGGLHWETYNYKPTSEVEVIADVPPQRTERELFANFGRGGDNRNYCLLNHAGKGALVKAGAFLARIVAVGTSPEEVQRGLQAGKELVSWSIGKTPAEEPRKEAMLAPGCWR